MENKRILIALIFFYVAVPSVLFAYGVETHKAISDSIIKTYEDKNGDTFTAYETQLIINGSAEEDNGTRPLQHFFDPLNDRGLSVLKTWLSSRIWAQDTEAQGNYCDWGICSKRIGYSDKYFSSPTDYSWDRAIYEYAHGDKNRALESLGHVLHLIQDASVPAHVRNDQHLNHNGFGDPDAYEAFTTRLGIEDFSIPNNLQTKEFSGINDAFKKLATFTNANFITKDSLLKYPSPNLDTMPIKANFVYDLNSNRKVAWVKIKKDLFGKTVSKEFFDDDAEHNVSMDSWGTLSKELFSTGVGVIDLFFRDVEQEKKTKALLAKNTSEAERQAKRLAQKGFKYVKALYGSSLAQEDIDELLNDQPASAAAAFNTVNTGEIQNTNPTNTQQSTSNTQTTVFQNQSDAPITPTIPDPAPAAPSPAPAAPASPALPSPPTPPAPVGTPGFSLTPIPGNPQSGGGGGGGGGSGGGGSSTPAPSVSAPDAPVVTSPAEGSSFNTNNVTFTGTAPANKTVEMTTTLGVVTTSVDGSGNWSVALSSIPEGSITPSFKTLDGSVGSSAVTRQITVDLTAPAAPTPSVSECTYSLSASFCLIPTTTATAAWGAMDGIARYVVELNGTVVANTTSNTASISLTNNASSTLKVAAYDAAGNGATSTAVIAFPYTRPVVINEVAWMGTAASADDEWFEMKNVSPYDLDLSKLVTLAADGAPYVALSGTLTASTTGSDADLTIVERRAEATTASGIISSFELLSDSGEQLQLAWFSGNATTTVDSTPTVATCSGWCKGSASTVVGTSASSGDLSAPVTMERIDASTDGTLSSNWRHNDTYVRADSIPVKDANTDTILGTPGKDNSSGLPTSGWACNGVLVTSGGNYTPGSDSCTYYSALISTLANRYGDLYKGTVGSATIVNGHSLGKNIKKDETDTLSSPVAGGQFFVAIYEIRTSIDSDLIEFRSYFQTNGTPAPHTNYVTIPWTYQP